MEFQMENSLKIHGPKKFFEHESVKEKEEEEDENVYFLKNLLPCNCLPNNTFPKLI